jgi:hypothetical protein
MGIRIFLFWARPRRGTPGTGLSLQFLDFARQLRCLGKVCGISALSLALAKACGFRLGSFTKINRFAVYRKTP